MTPLAYVDQIHTLDARFFSLGSFQDAVDNYVATDSARVPVLHQYLVRATDTISICHGSTAAKYNNASFWVARVRAHPTSLWQSPFNRYVCMRADG